MKSISIDGSAFDSTQFAELQEIVDDAFWETIDHHLLSTLEGVKASCDYFTQDVDQVHQRMKEFLVEKSTILFFYVGDLGHTSWDE